MTFIDWLKDFMTPNQQTIYLNQAAISSAETKLAIEQFAIAAAINLVASSVSKCEFRTYKDNKEIKELEYYLWNVEPNVNQNSSQFLQELITKLLYYNECLVIEINGQLIIADSYYQEEYATRENYFIQVTRGTMNFDKAFPMSQVLFFKLGHNNIRMLLNDLLSGYNDLLNMSINKYKRSGGRKGILDIDTQASGNKDFNTKLDVLMNKRFKTYFDAENAVLPLEKGYTYQEQAEGKQKSNSEIVDISAITKESFERVAQGFKMSPSLLRGDIADISAVTDNFLTFCIDPIIDMIAEEIIRKRIGRKLFLAGNYLNIDGTAIKHTDIFSVAASVDKLIACGMYDIDELRRKLGDNAINKDFSKKHWMTRNYQSMEELGGDTTV